MELECYGRGGLSKPSCTQAGCDVEHTPGVHKLMGENSAGVNVIAGDESEDEDETREEDRTREEDKTKGGGSGRSAQWRCWTGRRGSLAVFPVSSKHMTTTMVWQKVAASSNAGMSPCQVSARQAKSQKMSGGS
jgi:hypothetical protein